MNKYLITHIQPAFSRLNSKHLRNGQKLFPRRLTAESVLGKGCFWSDTEAQKVQVNELLTLIWQCNPKPSYSLLGSLISVDIEECNSA